MDSVSIKNPINLIGEVAEKLIDVDPDVTETDLSYNAPCFTAKVERPSKSEATIYQSGDISDLSLLADIKVHG